MLFTLELHKCPVPQWPWGTAMSPLGLSWPCSSGAWPVVGVLWARLLLALDPSWGLSVWFPALERVPVLPCRSRHKVAWTPCGVLDPQFCLEAGSEGGVGWRPGVCHAGACLGGTQGASSPGRMICVPAFK